MSPSVITARRRPRLVHVSQSQTLGGIAAAIRAELSCSGDLDVGWHTLSKSPVTRALGPLLHRALYGSGAETELAAADPWPQLREFGQQEAARLAPHIAGADVLLLHDPLCLTLAPYVRPLVGSILWRCHIGNDVRAADTDAAIAGLMPYLASVDRVAFLRRPYVWPGIDPARVLIVPPGIDPGAVKNRRLEPKEVESGQAALESGVWPDDAGRVVLDDQGTGWLTSKNAPYVLQVSRWDRLKGHAGVLAGFAGLAAGYPDLELVLAGPHVDPARSYKENMAVHRQLLATHAELPSPIRRRAHIWTFAEHAGGYEPMVVNLLQRSARVVVQNSLREAFGLTVTEALWKRAAVLASAVGGLAEQVENGVTGVLAEDTDGGPHWQDQLRFALADETRRRAWGEAGHRKVAANYLASGALRRQLQCLGWAL